MKVERRSQTIMTALALIGCSQASASATTSPNRALARAAQDFDAAQLRGDGAALERLLASDYVLLNGDGSEEDRTGFIRDYTSPGFHLEPFEVRHALLRTWPGGAVMSGVARLAGTSDGNAFDRCIRFTDVWSLRRGKWLVAFTNVSRPPEHSCGGE